MLECEACVGDRAGMEKLEKKKKKKGERESTVLLLESLCLTAMSLNKHVNKLALIAMNVSRRPVPIVHGNF